MSLPIRVFKPSPEHERQGLPDTDAMEGVEYPKNRPLPPHGLIRQGAPRAPTYAGPNLGILARNIFLAVSPVFVWVPNDYVTRMLQLGHPESITCVLTSPLRSYRALLLLELTERFVHTLIFEFCEGLTIMKQTQGAIAIRMGLGLMDHLLTYPFQWLRTQRVIEKDQEKPTSLIGIIKRECNKSPKGLQEIFKGYRFSVCGFLLSQGVFASTFLIFKLEDLPGERMLLVALIAQWTASLVSYPFSTLAVREQAGEEVTFRDVFSAKAWSGGLWEFGRLALLSTVNLAIIFRDLSEAARQGRRAVRPKVHP